MGITGSTLSQMSLSEIEQLFTTMKLPTIEQKAIAWKKTDTGIYDNEGNLIGDKCFDEDAYIEC